MIPKKPAKAFTLIELLIASILLVVIILALYTGFRVGALTQESAGRVSDELQSLRLFFNNLEQDLRNCIVYENSASATGINSGFSGDNTSLSFLTRTTKFISIGGKVEEINEVKAVSYLYGTVKIDDEQKNVVFKQEFALSDFLKNSLSILPPTADAANIAAEGVDDLKIFYVHFPASKRAEEIEWLATNAEIPDEVKIEVTLLRHGQRIKFTRSIILPLNIRIQ